MLNNKRENMVQKLILLLIILSTTLSLLLACISPESNYGDGDGLDTNVSGIDNNNISADGSAAEPPERIFPNLPEMDFDGFEFRIITSDYLLDTNMPREIGAEELTGDIMNDAIHRRNSAIEEQFNINIVELLHNRDDLQTPVRRAILAGDHSYDLIAGNIRSLGMLSHEGFLHNLRDVPHIDLDKPWYCQNAIADLSIANRVHYVVTELQISAKDATWAILFNKRLHNDLGLDDPYQLVRDGRWTMDRMFEMATTASVDLNGDGVMDEDDQWGMLGETFNIYALMRGSGTRLIRKDDNDLPYYAGFTSRDINIFYRAADFLGDPTRSLLSHQLRDSSVFGFNSMFATNRVLFFFTSLSRVTWHRGMETDFGILPIPKFDEAQEYYSHVVTVWIGSGVGIPTNLHGADLERSAIILEALSAESMYTLTPAYFDIQLHTQLLRDEESAEMLDIIFANRTYSLAQLHDWGGLIGTLTGLLGTEREFASSMERIEGMIERAIERTIDAYLDLH